MEAGQGHVVTDILEEAAPSKQEGPSESEVIIHAYILCFY